MRWRWIIFLLLQLSHLLKCWDQMVRKFCSTMELHQLLTYANILYKYNVHCFGKILWNIIFNKYHIKSCGWMTLNSLRVVFVLPMYSYFLSWLGHLLVCCLQSFQIISHLSYFPTAVSMVSFTVLNQLLRNQLILWKWSCATNQHDNLSPPPPPPKKKN